MFPRLLSQCARPQSHLLFNLGHSKPCPRHLNLVPTPKSMRCGDRLIFFDYLTSNNPKQRNPKIFFPASPALNSSSSGPRQPKLVITTRSRQTAPTLPPYGHPSPSLLFAQGTASCHFCGTSRHSSLSVHSLASTSRAAPTTLGQTPSGQSKKKQTTQRTYCFGHPGNSVELYSLPIEF